MMYNTRYLPENFEQCRLEKTILQQFPYNLSVRSRWNALIQDGGKYHEKAYECTIFDIAYFMKAIAQLIFKIHYPSNFVRNLQ